MSLKHFSGRLQLFLSIAGFSNGSIPDCAIIPPNCYDCNPPGNKPGRICENKKLNIPDPENQSGIYWRNSDTFSVAAFTIINIE